MRTCIISEYDEDSVLQEIKVEDSRAETFKISGSSRLQTIDEVNANRRIYRMAICERFVDAANDKIKNKRMLGELDHPMPTDVNEAMQLRRQVSVLWEKAIS